MLALSLIIVSLLILAIATYTDIRTLEVPDWLNYAGITAGIGMHIIIAAQTWNYWPILSSFIGLSIAFAIACMMFYTGQWGGGDAKLLMALGAIIGFEPSRFAFGTNYLVNLVFIGGAWGILWSGGLALKNKKTFWKKFKELRIKEPFKRMRIITLLTAVSLIITSFIIKELQLEILALAIISYALCYLTIFIKAVELSGMHKWITPDKLTEGDWLLKTVKAGNITIKPPRLGLETKEVNLLKKLYKQKKIKKVLIKYGIPFVPAFLAAFVLTLIYGNIIIALLF